MKNKLMLMVLGLFLVSIVSAVCPSDVTTLTGSPFKQGNSIELKQICDTCTYVTLSSISYPDSSSVYINENMTKLGINYNYSFSNTTLNGQYGYSVLGDKDGSIASESFCFEVNPSGISPSDSKTATISLAIWILFAIAVILFLCFAFIKSKPPIKWTFFLLSMMFLLQTISLLFTNMQNQVVDPKIVHYFDFLASSSFILFWFAFGLLAVLWIITSLQTYLLNTKQRKQEKYQ